MNSLASAAAMLTATAHAQTLQTNLVAAHPTFREIGGQLYNTDLSQRFASIKGRCLSISNGVSFVQKITEKHIYARPDILVSSGNFIGTSPTPIGPRIIKTIETPGPIILISNSPAWSPQEKINFRAMPIGETPDRIQIYDYGRPHIVVVISTNFSGNKINERAKGQ